MAFYRQSIACPKFAGNGASSAGAGYGRNDYPRGVPVYAPEKLPPGMENPSRWTPFGTFQPHPYFGGHDALGGRLMHVAQADTYNAAPNPFPANSVNDQPNAWFTPGSAIIRLEPSTSAHMGLSMAPEFSPNMVFHAPPVFGFQTVPIMAVGA